MSCRSVRPWLHLASEALPEPERLVLEEHLQACERCREERAQLGFVRRIARKLPVESIGQRGHSRAIAAALMRGRREPAPATRQRGWMYALGGAALAAAVVVAVIVVRDRDDAPIVARPAPLPPPPPRPIPAPTPAPAPERVVLEGELSHDGVVLAAHAEIPADVRLRALQRTGITFYGARVTIAAASEIVVHTDRSILVERGALETDRDVTVHTARFAMQVDGAVTLTTDTVRVTRGSATVTHAGATKRIDAGATWKVPDVKPPRAGDALARARTAYTASAFEDAQREATAALAANPTRAQAAEAHTIVADCLQATGKLAAATTRYETIANQYADLAAGETALFAAARLTAKAGRADAARALFQRYLTQYPTGRFADEAKHASEAP